MKMRIAVCDDDDLMRQELGKKIMYQRPACRIDEFGSGEDLLAAGILYDLIFL